MRMRAKIIYIWKNQSGSMTLELALLSGIILFVLISFLYLSLFMRDIWVLNQSCRIYASAYARKWDTGEELLEEDAQKECLASLNGQMLIVQVTRCQIEETENEVQVCCQGMAYIPFREIAMLFGGDGWNIAITQRRAWHPLQSP